MHKLRKIFYNKLFKLFRSNDFFYSASHKTKIDSKLIYVPHPFTNWSLNPNYHIKGKYQHTIEGFRRTLNYKSVKEYVKNSDPNSKKIFCVGGSTTYCTELSDYQMTWPYKLQDKINSMLPNKVVIVNGGVGGWGTLQSMIRFSGWGPILKPDLTIIYQSKNDLTPIYNGRGVEKEIFPLYENIMLQFSSQFPFGNFFKALHPKDLGTVYSDKILTHPNGMQRFSNEFVELSLLRYGMIADLANTWKGKVLFIPEVIDKNSFYFSQMQLIHKQMKKTAEGRFWCDYFDIINVFPEQSSFFLDKMHFSEKGCDVFSDLLIQKIISTFQN